MLLIISLEDRVEFRTSTARTPLQAVLEAVNLQIDGDGLDQVRSSQETANHETGRDDRRDPLMDGDTTMTTV